MGFILESTSGKLQNYPKLSRPTIMTLSPISYRL